MSKCCTSRTRGTSDTTPHPSSPKSVPKLEKTQKKNASVADTGTIHQEVAILGIILVACRSPAPDELATMGWL